MLHLVLQDLSHYITVLQTPRSQGCIKNSIELYITYLQFFHILKPLHLRLFKSTYNPFLITKRYNIEIQLCSIAQSTGQYFPLLPSCRSNTLNQLIQYWYLKISLGLRLYFIVRLEKCFFLHNQILSLEGLPQ